MARLAIKICGINAPAALDAAIAARADYAGLVFVAASPRAVSARDAAALAARGAGRIALVGLFVDADDAAIGAAVAAARLDAIQLHGHETPQRAAQLRAAFGLPVWRALPVASAGDVAAGRGWAGAADRVLFDARPLPGAALTGGSGLSFDWSLLAAWRDALPWGLAGGLSPENAHEAVRRTGAPLVDVSSGVERAPGVKDPARIAAFCAAARG